MTTSKWLTYTTSLLSASIIITVLILTLSHGRFECKVDTGEEVKNCSDYSDYGITQTEDEICQGAVFHLTSDSVSILCPWSTGTLVLTVIGSIIAFVFVIMALCRQLGKMSIMLRFRRLIGLACLGLMIISPILMIVNLGGGGAKCREFHDELGDNEDNAHCSNVNYGATFILALVNLFIFGILVFRKEVTQEFEYTNDEYEKDRSLTRFDSLKS